MTAKSNMKNILSVAEFRRRALPLAEKRFSPQRVAAYFDRGGSETGTSDRRNREVLDKIFFKQQIIHDFEPSTETEFLGHTLGTPIMIAPMARMATLLEDGVGKMCEATHMTGSMTWIATNPPEFYSKHTSQHSIIYIMKPLENRAKLLNSLQVAEQEGCIAVGIDAESGGGHKLGDTVSKGPYKLLSVQELKDIRSNLSKPFIIKGVLSVEDAHKAVEIGADAIVVSNHYGVILDYSQSPIEALAKIARTVGDTVDIILDGQMRRGTDVLKALALGAKAVLLGRPIFWAALVGGKEGMAHLINLMTEELQRAMLYTGTKSLSTVSRDILLLPHEILGTKIL